jgi:hypothetical protein
VALLFWRVRRYRFVWADRDGEKEIKKESGRKRKMPIGASIIQE